MAEVSAVNALWKAGTLMKLPRVAGRLKLLMWADYCVP